MQKRKALLALAAVLFLTTATPVLAAPAAAQEETGGPGAYVRIGIALAAGFGMAFASGLCGIAQGRAVAAACDGISRNPNAAGLIRGALIIGLILIESLAIYTLLVAMYSLVFLWD